MGEGTETQLNTAILGNLRMAYAFEDLDLGQTNTCGFNTVDLLGLTHAGT